MRQWMVDPRIMCRQHLLGEHVEHHMFVGTLRRGKRVAGFLRDNLLELPSLPQRHQELVAEMTRRGYNHQSELLDYNLFGDERDDVKIDKVAALAELLRRCPACRARHTAMTQESQL